MPFILASASPRRHALLTLLGVHDICTKPANLDETPMKGELPDKLALRLSYEKAVALAQKIDDPENAPVILAADTVAALGRRILPSPQTECEARASIEKLSGRSHRVYTGLCVRTREGRFLRRLVTTRLVFKRLSQAEIEAYAQSHEGIGKAGGYAIQGFGGSFVKSLTGSYSAVMGLPLLETVHLLRQAGVACTPPSSLSS